MNKEEIKKALKKLRDEAIDIYMNAEDNSYKEIYHDGHSDAYDSALDFIDQLDEPDKMVIPEFVAEWWEQEGDSVKLYGGLRVEKKDKLDLISKLCDMWLDDHLLKVEDWIIENDLAFLDLVNGKPYEVEEEKLYYIKFSENQYAQKFDGTKFDSMLINDESLAGKFTKDDIKKMNPNLMALAVEVEVAE